jgi:hypothetical protein
MAACHPDPPPIGSEGPSLQVRARALAAACASRRASYRPFAIPRAGAPAPSLAR